MQGSTDPVHRNLRTLPLARLTLALALGCASRGGGSSPDAAAAPPAPPDVDAGACIGPTFAGAPLGIRCGALVDAEGRTVLLRGMNARIQGIWDVSLDGGRTPFLQVPPFALEDAQRIRALGFNALRLAMNWSGLEPTETGGFDDTYLDKVAAVIAMCKAAGLYVLIDLHQDGYSKELGGDGAPLWAIVPPPTKAFSSPLSAADSTLAQKETSDAFTTFFGPSADGARLRDRFVKMAAHVMTRFADDPTVLGLEIMNEPLASDTDLWAFDRQVIPAVQAVAPTKLVLFEPNAVRNILGSGTIGTGSLGAGTVYAPHVYTLAFTGTIDQKNAILKETLRPSNESARAEADGFLAPLVITEFGFDPSVAIYASYIRWQNELEDEYLAGSFFWVWKEYGTWGFFTLDAQGNATEQPAVVAAHARVRLEAAAGRIVSVVYDADTKHLEAQIVGAAAITAPNLVSIGVTPGFASYRATCDGAPVTATAGEPLAIPCGGAGLHTLTLAPQ